MPQKKDYSGKLFSNPYKRFPVSGPIKKRFIRFSKWLLFLLPLLTVFAAVYVVFFTQYFVVTNVSLAGEYRSDHEARLLEQGSAVTQGSNILWISSKRIRKAVSGEDILSVSIDKEFPRSVVITVHERMPKFQIKRGESTFLTDQNGFVVSPGVNSDLVQIEMPTTTPEIVDRKQALTKEDFVFFDSLVEIMDRENNIQIKTIQILSNNLLDIRVYSQKKWYLVLDTLHKPESFAEALKSFLIEKYSIENSLHYIDLRIQDTVFYK